MRDSERHKELTGGFIAPVAFMHYDQDGRCVATSPDGGLTVLDQFALSVLGEVVAEGFDFPMDSDKFEHYAARRVDAAYVIAKAMLKRKREIEAGE